MRKAYSYQRFSSIKQREGDSLKRQAAAAQAFCKQQGVQLVREIKHGIWTNATVAELLRNRNVVGWFGINSNEFNDYFPAIISAKTFQDAQTKLDFNIKSRGGSKYGLVRNLFKGLLCCAECGQTIETKIGQYKNVKGSVNHYADYICRGVKQHTGCKNHGRINVSAVELAIFENVLFSHPNQLTATPSIKTTLLTNLENDLARLQSVIARLTDLTSDVILQNEAGLKAKLKQAVTDKALLQEKIKQEQTKAARIEALPIATKTLNSLITFEKPASDKDLSDWLASYARFNSDKNKRKQLRNLMDSIFERITLKYTKADNGLKTEIECRLVSGTMITTTIIKNSLGFLFTKNNPKTKKPDTFKLYRDNKTGKLIQVSLEGA